MPRGSKEKYSSKQKRKAEHIEEGYEKRGVRTKEAERRAWATVNKQEGGGKKGGSGTGRKTAASKSSARPGTKSRSTNRSTNSTSSRTKSRGAR
jgi:plasmid stabilization system protein ParE